MRAWHDNGTIRVILEDGRKISFPITTTALLATATPDQLNNIELSPFGLHWPDVDEDLSVSGLLRDYGHAS